VRPAIDEFGQGHSSLARPDELPFAELKLARAFVIDCGIDKAHAPLCRTVIDPAHHFGRKAVAMGIEKASKRSRSSAWAAISARVFWRRHTGASTGGRALAFGGCLLERDQCVQASRRLKAKLSA
jgi:predicted signal transduction protein with EAL and GGDEF domain